MAETLETFVTPEGNAFAYRHVRRRGQKNLYLRVERDGGLVVSSPASMAKEAGARVVISAAGDALSRGLLAAPHIVKPDIRETPVGNGLPLTTRDEIIDAGKKIVTDGTGIVIVSHEVTGDIAITADGVWEILAPAEATEFKNFVGADDVLLAGIVHMLNKGESLEDALRFGMAAGVMSAESEVKICSDIDRIEKHMETISINKL